MHFLKELFHRHDTLMDRYDLNGSHEDFESKVLERRQHSNE